MLNEQVKKASINYKASSGDPGEKQNSFHNDHCLSFGGQKWKLICEKRSIFYQFYALFYRIPVVLPFPTIFNLVLRKDSGTQKYFLARLPALLRTITPLIIYDPALSSILGDTPEPQGSKHIPQQGSKVSAGTELGVCPGDRWYTESWQQDISRSPQLLQPSWEAALDRT